MNCIIIEDQPPAQRVLQKYIQDTGSLQLLNTFEDAVEALEFLKKEKVDLIFLDIHLPKISGIDFLGILPDPPQVILTTAFQDYALEGYELNVTDYLLKPFSFQRFLKAVTKAESKRAEKFPTENSSSSNHEIFLKSGYDHIRVDIHDIQFIKSDADYSEVHLPSATHLSSESLKSWIDILDPGQFVRIHKSYIVNTAKIIKVRGNRVHLENNKEIPIGRAFRDDFVKRFLN